MDPSVKEQFQAITHATDQKADFYLSAADGDLQRAIEMFLTNDSQGDASTSGAGADAPASDGGDRAATAGEPPPAAPARRGVLRLVLSAAAATLRGLQRVADTMLGVLLPLSWHEALKELLRRLLFMQPAAADGELSAALVAEFGGELVPFVRDGFDGAVRRSTARNLPLFLYLHDPDSEVSAAFCRAALCDAALRAVLAHAFVCVAVSTRSRDGRDLARQLRVRACPYVAFLQPAPGQPRAPFTLAAVHEGPGAADDVLAAAQTALAAAERVAGRAARASAALQSERSVREQQDAALAASMAADAERARERDAAAAADAEARAEAACAAAEERDAAQRAKDERTRRGERIALRQDNAAAALPAEAPPGPGTCLVRLRLAGGESPQRRFAAGATIGDVYGWVDALGVVGAWNFALASTYPRREFERDGDGGSELAELGLVPNAALMVIARDDD